MPRKRTYVATLVVVAALGLSAVLTLAACFAVIGPIALPE